MTIALDLLGDKWSLLILRDIFFKEKKYYGDFLNSAEKISTNILADRLKKMEEGGVLLKNTDPMNASKYVYRLTPKGKDLLPLLLEMIEWSVKHEPGLYPDDEVVEGAPANLIARSKQDRPALMAEILNKLQTIE